MQPEALLVREGFFDAQLCEKIAVAMTAGNQTAATLYGNSSLATVDERVRKAIRVTPHPEIVLEVQRRLLALKPEVEEHFSVNLQECEDPQFLRYVVGGFFVAHQDGNTGLLKLDQESRLISVVISLSRGSMIQSDGTYCGGELLFHKRTWPTIKFEVPPMKEVGTLVAFRSETTHEVAPVTHGERLSIASWYR